MAGGHPEDATVGSWIGGPGGENILGQRWICESY